MTTSELAEAQARYRARIATILTPDDLAIYTAYQGRLLRASGDEVRDPPTLSPDEHRILALIERDDEASALYKQIQVFLRNEKLPQ